MRDGLREVITDEPTISDVGFDFFDRLAHGANAKQTLNERNFDQYNRIDAGTTIVWTIKVLNEIVNETEVDGLINLAYKVIFGYQFIQRDKRNL